jgi:hypothetical protein
MVCEEDLRTEAWKSSALSEFGSVDHHEPRPCDVPSGICVLKEDERYLHLGLSRMPAVRLHPLKEIS